MSSAEPDPRLSVALPFSAVDLSGHELSVPDPDRDTLLIFLRHLM